MILYLTDGVCFSEAQEELWTELKAAAESGWDFSSRWYSNTLGHNSGSLRDTRTSAIVPVDLNALLCRNERVLATFHRILGEQHTTSTLGQIITADTLSLQTAFFFSSCRKL